MKVYKKYAVFFVLVIGVSIGVGIGNIPSIEAKKEKNGGQRPPVMMTKMTKAPRTTCTLFTKNDNVVQPPMLKKGRWVRSDAGETFSIQIGCRSGNKDWSITLYANSDFYDEKSTLGINRDSTAVVAQFGQHNGSSSRAVAFTACEPTNKLSQKIQRTAHQWFNTLGAQTDTKPPVFQSNGPYCWGISTTEEHTFTLPLKDKKLNISMKLQGGTAWLQGKEAFPMVVGAFSFHVEQKTRNGIHVVSGIDWRCQLNNIHSIIDAKGNLVNGCLSTVHSGVKVPPGKKGEIGLAWVMTRLKGGAIQFNQAGKGAEVTVIIPLK